jgi:tetratricopeptide (TPR) repeat protein
LGNQGNWEQAANEIQTAARADPGFAWYWLQSGYAFGRAARTNPILIEEGISAYERGIAIEPEYSLSRANLASLLWTRGFQEEALRQMRIATSLAPESWLLLVNEGVFEEELSLSSDAMSSYSLAINFRPDLVRSNFWSESELRNGATQIATETTVLDDPRKEAAALVEAARLKTETSEFDSARLLLEQAHELFDQNVSLYTVLGELAFEEGDLETAEKYVQMALWTQATSNEAKVEAVLLGAEISLARGDHVEALSRYEIAYKAILAETSYGWGSSGWPPYAWFVFQSESFDEDLLPQLERADISIQTATRLLRLVELYEEVGESEKASEVRLALQPYLP